jgi:hypothetical protein
MRTVYAGVREACVKFINQSVCMRAERGPPVLNYQDSVRTLVGVRDNYVKQRQFTTYQTQHGTKNTVSTAVTVGNSETTRRFGRTYRWVNQARVTLKTTRPANLLLLRVYSLPR